MTQPFFTTMEQTGKEGCYVSLNKTVKDVADIIKGKYDILHPEKLMYIGEIKEVV
jgi:F0F1-type ATP synthase beta subunit